MTKLIHCTAAGLWVLVPSQQVSAQGMTPLHQTMQGGEPMTEGLFLVFALFAVLTLGAALTGDPKRGPQRRSFFASGSPRQKVGKTTKNISLFWASFSRRELRHG